MFTKKKSTNANVIDLTGGNSSSPSQNMLKTPPKIKFNIERSFEGSENNDQSSYSMVSSTSPFKFDENVSTLDFSDKGLENLGILTNKKLRKMANIILANNMLQNINDLSAFTKLTSIDARSNGIKEARLKLPNLVELNLSDNVLTEVIIIKSNWA